MPVGFKTNADTFRKSISKLARDLEVRPSDILRTLVPSIVTELASGSPVGETDNPDYNYAYKPKQGYEAGWYASNWQVTFGSPSDTPRTNAGDSQAIGYSIDQAFASMQLFRVKSTPNIWISNPVPYAQLIEEGHAKDVANVLKDVLARYPKLLDDAILKTALQNKN